MGECINIRLILTLELNGTAVYSTFHLSPPPFNFFISMPEVLSCSLPFLQAQGYNSVHDTEFEFHGRDSMLICMHGIFRSLSMTRF